MDDLTAGPILRRCCGALEALHGERLVAAVLFGSRARGEAGGDSDHDAAVFLADAVDRSAEGRWWMPRPLRQGRSGNARR